jgi:hypothetical protein
MSESSEGERTRDDIVSQNRTPSERGTPQWEIGVTEAGSDNWEHHHPRAKTADEARQQAQRDSNFFDPIVYMTEGPFHD